MGGQVGGAVGGQVMGSADSPLAVALPAIAGFVWVLLAAGVALMPMRRQFVPGFALLLAAPLLILWLGIAYGPWPPILATLAFVSMFRRPLAYLSRRALGMPARPPATDQAATEGRADRGEAP